jgi:hypothetical protein
MKLTSFGFVALAETFLKEALSSPPIGGGLWSFQRSVNFNDRTGSLQILLTTPAGTSKTRASLQARQTGTSKDFSIQGWSEISGDENRTLFVLKESNPYRAEEEVFEIVDRLLSSIPERDQSAVIKRPSPPPPKSTFEPLIPEIQSPALETETEPPEPAPGSAEESADSAQAFIDSLLSAGNVEEAAAIEEPAIEATPAAETEVKELPLEEAAPKPKASKPKKSAK